MKRYVLLRIVRHHKDGATIHRAGKPEKILSEAQARRIDKLLRSDGFGSFVHDGGRIFYPLTTAEWTLA